MEPFSLPYFREALAEILLLAVPCGLIGSWIVLRGLAFHSHAVGTATFPGVVLADGLGFAALPGAIAAALAFTVFSVAIGRSRRTGADAVTALALSACLAAGIILASDVFGSGAGVDTLLFGSLLAIGTGDLWLAGAATGLAAVASILCGHHWLARGFDPGSAAGLRSGSAWFDAVLLTVVAVVVVSSLAAAGALLVAALVVIPAATVRLFARRVPQLQLATTALVAFEGLLGLWLSARTDAPPGATIAVTSGVLFLAALASRTAARQLPGTRRFLLPAASGLVLAGLVWAGTGCGPGQPSGEGPRVVATTTQVGDLVREIGGDRVRLTTILKPNTDPHDYEPRPSDVRALAEADLVFRSGGSLDRWTTRLAADGGSTARVIDLGKRLPVLLHSGGEPDPHWWQDPVNAVAAANRIEAVLSRHNAGSSRYYRQRASRFASASRRLTTRIRGCIAEIPPRNRRIVTDHDAFAYFTNRFGIDTVGTLVPALSTGAAPSAGDLAELERTIRQERVKAVFPERSAPPALAEAIARDTGATTGRLLYGDSLGPAGSPGGSLRGAIRTNADAIIRGISGARVDCFGGSRE